MHTIGWCTWLPDPPRTRLPSSQHSSDDSTRRRRAGFPVAGSKCPVVPRAAHPAAAGPVPRPVRQAGSAGRRPVPRAGVGGIRKDDGRRRYAVRAVPEPPLDPAGPLPPPGGGSPAAAVTSAAASSAAESVLAALDPEQQQVALATRGPVCVLAGAGTGKTRAIAH